MWFVPEWSETRLPRPPRRLWTCALVTPEEQDRVDALIRGLTPVLAGAKVEVTGGVERPPMPRSETIGRIYESASNLAIELGMELQEESVGAARTPNSLPQWEFQCWMD